MKEEKIKGGSLQNAYADNFDFTDRLKINSFGGIKKKRLIYIEGYYTTEKKDINFHTAFFSPIGNSYFNGTIKNGKIEGILVTKDSIAKGKMYGRLYENINPTPPFDYTQLFFYVWK